MSHNTKTKKTTTAEKNYSMLAEGIKAGGFRTLPLKWVIVQWWIWGDTFKLLLCTGGF